MNPWGLKGLWHGPWSYSSALWDTHPEVERCASRPPPPSVVAAGILSVVRFGNILVCMISIEALWLQRPVCALSEAHLVEGSVAHISHLKIILLFIHIFRMNSHTHIHIHVHVHAFIFIIIYFIFSQSVRN